MKKKCSAATSPAIPTTASAPPPASSPFSGNSNQSLATFSVSLGLKILAFFRNAFPPVRLGEQRRPGKEEGTTCVVRRYSCLASWFPWFAQLVSLSPSSAAGAEE